MVTAVHHHTAPSPSSTHAALGQAALCRWQGPQLTAAAHEFTRKDLGRLFSVHSGTVKRWDEQRHWIRPRRENQRCLYYSVGEILNLLMKGRRFDRDVAAQLGILPELDEFTATLQPHSQERPRALEGNDPAPALRIVREALARVQNSAGFAGELRTTTDYIHDLVRALEQAEATPHLAGHFSSVVDLLVACANQARPGASPA